MVTLVNFFIVLSLTVTGVIAPTSSPVSDAPVSVSVNVSGCGGAVRGGC